MLGEKGDVPSQKMLATKKALGETWLYFFLLNTSRWAELGDMRPEAELVGQPYQAGVCPTLPIVLDYEKFQTHREVQRPLLQNIQNVYPNPNLTIFQQHALFATDIYLDRQ